MADLDSLPFTPLNDPLRQLVFGACGRSIETVLVDGRAVVKEGTVTTVDERSVMREARRMREASQVRNAEIYAFTDRLMPYLLQIN
jgi:cytosine/adenosine deaminase-related metal-dependent hydrolase